MLVHWLCWLMDCVGPLVVLAVRRLCLASARRVWLQQAGRGGGQAAGLRYRVGCAGEWVALSNGLLCRMVCYGWHGLRRQSLRRQRCRGRWSKPTAMASAWLLDADKCSDVALGAVAAESVAAESVVRVVEAVDRVAGAAKCGRQTRVPTGASSHGLEYGTALVLVALDARIE